MKAHYNKLWAQGVDAKREQIMLIWSFKRKRHADGSLNKCKARLCCHGGQQEHGINYWDTYSPVVSWVSVRTMLILSAVHQLESRSIDFTLAYPQALVKTNIYLHSPRGNKINRHGKDTVLKLIRNLHGLKDASKTWFEHCSEAFQKMGYVPSNVNTCVFLRNDSIIICYVDDVLIFSKSNEVINSILEALKSQNFVFTIDDNVDEYLGIQISHKKDGLTQFSQPFLIKRIIQAIPGMQEANMSHAPMSLTLILTKDLKGKPRKGKWHYRSLIGMLNFLANSTHPENACAVHECAGFCENPILSHENTVH